MARKVVTTVEVTSDFDPNVEADDSVEFIYDNVKYTIDCSSEQGEEFREYLQLWMDVASDKVKIPKAALASLLAGKTLPAATPGVQAIDGKRAAPVSPPGEPTEVRQAIRQWARESGKFPDIQDRGLVHQHVRDAYTKATGIEVGANVYPGEGTGDRSREIRRALDAGEPVPPPNKAKPGKANAHGITPEMREWAREHGLLGNRGYIAKEHREQFHAEQAQLAAIEDHANNNHLNGALV